MRGEGVHISHVQNRRDYFVNSIAFSFVLISKNGKDGEIGTDSEIKMDGRKSMKLRLTDRMEALATRITENSSELK